jgi:hypothetical protein
MIIPWFTHKKSSKYITRHLLLFMMILQLEDPKVWKQNCEYNNNNFKTVSTVHALSHVTTRVYFDLPSLETKC